jgi:hypothetical protein
VRDLIFLDELVPQPRELVLVSVGSVTSFEVREVDAPSIDATLRRIFDQARDYASNPCVHPSRPG